MYRTEVSAEHDRIGAVIVDAAFKVHKALGPGLLEKVYEACVTRELQKRDLLVTTQVPVPIRYDGEELDEGFRLDLLVEDQVIVEIKAVQNLNPVFQAQLMTYLRLSNRPLGYLINFNVPLIKNGIRRMALTRKPV